MTSQEMFPIPSLRSGNETLGSQPSFLAMRAPREIPFRMKASTRANTTSQQVQLCGLQMLTHHKIVTAMHLFLNLILQTFRPRMTSVSGKLPHVFLALV